MALTVVACACGPAHAMTGLLMLDPPPAEGVRWATGVSMWRLHTGPDDRPPRRTWVYPAVEVRAANGWFASTDVGVGWGLRHGAVEAGWRWSAWPSRSTAGLHIGPRLEQGAYLNASLGDAVLLQSSLRHGGGRRGDGWIAEAGATSGVPLPHGELIGVTLGSSWANGAYRTSYDGPGTPMPGGWQEVQCALAYEHRLTVHWRLDAQWLSARVVEGGGPQGRDPAYQRSLSIGLWRDWP